MLRGTRIITGDEAAKYVSTIDYMRKFMISHNFEEVILPAIWEQEAFVNKAGEEVLDQMYVFKDKKDRDICLIPEATAIIQQQYNESWAKEKKKPIKIFYVQKCYRYERPQKGRYREFTQFGIEILGGDKKSKEEAIALLAQIFIDFDVEYIYSCGVSRGLSYYIENGFEIEVPFLGAQKQVAGGGTYAEGVGWAIGIDRFLLALEDKEQNG